MFFSRAKRRKFQQWAVFALLVLVVYLYRDSVRSTACGILSSVIPSHSILCTEELVVKEWSLFYHLGGNGPWIQKVKGVVENDQALPQGCVVDQVHMLSRHAERYPTGNAGARQLSLLERLEKSERPARGSLSFLSKWTYFTNLSDPHFEDLTSTGPYAGTLQAFNTGQKLRTRYSHLLEKHRPLNFWTCSSPRDVETAEKFADGFFGPAWFKDGSAKLHIIPEIAEIGANTLTPGDTCLKYIEDEESGHDQGYYKLAEWQQKFSEPIIDRLVTEAPGFDFTSIDVYSMMEMCGFEILARGSSPWCDVFTEQEWLNFEYARDLLHFYRAGPGNKYAGAMGWLWLNATQELISNETAGGLYFSFVHDGDIIPLMATLELFNERKDDIVTAADFWNMKQNLPVNRVKTDRSWKTSDIVPMGGRLIFERIDCSQAPFSLPSNQTFVRLSINDGHIDLSSHFEGDQLEHDMRLERFQAMVRAKGKKFGDFRSVCGLGENAPSKITFLHQ